MLGGSPVLRRALSRAAVGAPPLRAEAYAYAARWSQDLARALERGAEPRVEWLDYDGSLDAQPVDE